MEVIKIVGSLTTALTFMDNKWMHDAWCTTKHIIASLSLSSSSFDAAVKISQIIFQAMWKFLHMHWNKHLANGSKMCTPFIHMNKWTSYFVNGDLSTRQTLNSSMHSVCCYCSCLLSIQLHLFPFRLLFLIFSFAMSIHGLAFFFYAYR